MRVFSFSDWLSNAGSEGLQQFSLNQSYQRISWVYSCVNITATTASSAGLHFYKGNSQQASNRIVDPNHPVNQLFQSPKEPEIPSLRDLLYRTFSFLGMTGGIFWVFKRKKGVLTTLEPRVGLKPIFKAGDKTTLLGWEEQDENGNKVTYTIQQVLPILYFNPADPYSGLSPLLAARLSVETEFNIAGWNTSFFKSGMKNPMLLQAKGTLTKNQKMEIKKEITNYYSGIEGAHGALLLQGNIDVTDLKMSPKDVDFVQGKKLNREEICSIYGVPPALVGIFEYANYSNVKEQRKIFWENTLLPKMEKIRDLLQVNVLNKEFPGITCAWDTSQMLGLKEDPKDLATAAKTYYDMGYDSQQISVILNSPELDTQLNPGRSGADGLKPPAPTTPAPSADDNEDEEDTTEEEEQVNTFIPGRKYDTFLKWAESYSDLEYSDVYASINKVETSIDHYVKQLRAAAKKSPNLNTLRWLNVWEDTVERELAKVSNEAVLSSIRSLKAVSNQGAIKQVTKEDIKTYLTSTALKKIDIFIKGQLEDSKTIPSSLIGSIKAGDMTSWNRMFKESLLLAKTLVNSIRESIRYFVFETLGVKKLLWISRKDCHKVLHGQQIRLGKECFPSLEADHPYSKGLPLSEVMGCTCTTVPLEFVKI